MTKTTIIAAILFTAAATARAGGQAGSFGVGAEAELNGNIAGLSGSYDGGKFHAGALFGLHTDANMTNATEVDVAGLFFYHLHSTALADFGLGGGLGIDSLPAPAMMGTTRNTNVYLEPGLQIRLFVASNVALSFTSGISIGLSNGTRSVVSGQGTSLQGGAGVTYYFF